MIIQAQSLNYGEGIGNISELKKFTRGNGYQYTYISRQSLRYDIVRLGQELFEWKPAKVSKEKGTVQFIDPTIENIPEIDLFGYMKTKTKKGNKRGKKDEENEGEEGANNEGGAITRSAVVRLSHAVSLEPFQNDLEFLSNKGLADRIGEDPNLANIEQHASFYTYTVTIDLSKVGEDENTNTSLDNERKYERISQLLDTIKILNRNIRGRQENLSPLFAIGGVYEISNPFFLGRIEIYCEDGKYLLKTSILQSVLELEVKGQKVKDLTYIGMVDGIINNSASVKQLLDNGRCKDIEGFFETLKKAVSDYYGVNK
ncbi:MAG: type I-B CRISPR-associated protein Cas7/Cst2/DevR [Candidatus Rehaiarchaeum fermentans]|nr:type I-B CRISPR-associated protein Cas7/Cst2/DevR [Candidatus Rehaiarchaeum fermentans]